MSSPSPTCSSSSSSSVPPRTRVVCLRRQHGVVTQSCDIYIGRRMYMGGWRLQDSEWANPYSVKECGGSAEKACVKFEMYIRKKPELIARIEELRGKTLGCWCKKKTGREACHGDVLVKLLNEKDATVSISTKATATTETETETEITATGNKGKSKSNKGKTPAKSPVKADTKSEKKEEEKHTPYKGLLHGVHGEHQICDLPLSKRELCLSKLQDACTQHAKVISEIDAQQMAVACEYQAYIKHTKSNTYLAEIRTMLSSIQAMTNKKQLYTFTPIPTSTSTSAS